MSNVICVYCGKTITGCCYPAYNGRHKIGYRHTFCYASGGRVVKPQRKVVEDDYNYDYDEARYHEDE
jgi:hypothetical protein